jgi:DNA invertase Pin-like site-specific DNA recombinase
MKIGYARVSVNNHNWKEQIDALNKFGCKKIFREKQGHFNERLEFERMISQLHQGDMVVIFKLDRIGKSLKDLFNLFELFKNKSIDFVSLQDKIDISKKHGKLYYNIIDSFSVFEKALKREWTFNDPETAVKRRRKGGRPKGLSDNAINKAKKAKELYKNDTMPVADIVKSLGIGKTTLYRYLQYIHEDNMHRRKTELKMSDEKLNKNKIRKDLFLKLLESKAFWSYANVKYEKITDEMLIQKVMEELDIDDIRQLFILYNKNFVRKVWKEEMVAQDPYYRSLNILLAKLFFDIKNPEQYIKRVKREYQKSISG